MFILTLWHYNPLFKPMDNLSAFKQEIESMFEKSFQELSQKNNLNKA